MADRKAPQADEVAAVDYSATAPVLSFDDAARGREAMSRFDAVRKLIADGRAADLIASEARQVLAAVLGDADAVAGLACAAPGALASLWAVLGGVRGLSGPVGDLKKAVNAANRPAMKTSKRAQSYVADIGAALGWETRGIVAPGGYVVTDSGILQQTGGDEEGRNVLVAHRPLAITGVLHTPEGGAHVVIEYDHMRRHHRRVIRREVAMDARSLPSALPGGPAASDNARDVVRYLRAQEAANEERMPLATLHSSLGWQGDAFLAGRYALTSTGTTTTADPASTAPHLWPEGARFVADDGSFRSLLDAIAPTNRLADWRRLVGRAMTGRPAIAVAVHAAIASALLHVIGDCPLFVVEWSGDTSRGKTTALRVAASVWGSAEDGAFLSSWANTPTFIERLAGFLFSLPVILDDTAKIEPRYRDKVASIVYMFTSGQGKGRGTPGAVQATTRHRCILLSSGEVPLTSFSESAGGTHARSLILRGAPLGDESAEGRELGDRLRAELPHIGGDAGPAVIRWLLEHRDEWARLRERWAQLVAEMGRGLDAAAALRLAGPSALLLLAGELAVDVLGLPRVETAHRLRASMVEGGAGADRPLAALEHIRSWTAAAKSRFAKGPSDTSMPVGGVWLGRWDDDEPVPAIMPSALNEELRRAGYDAKAMVGAWRDRGWLVANSGRDPMVRMPGVATRMIVVRPEFWSDN